MKKKILWIFGFLFILFGISLLLNSFQGITGFVISEDVSVEVGGVIGFTFMLVGIFLILSVRIDERKYHDVASRIYQTLGSKGAYGHHTENIEDIERWVSGGNISKKDIKSVLKSEIYARRLNYDDKGGISITRNREKLEEILGYYGENIRDEVRKRLEELSRGRTPLGVR